MEMGFTTRDVLGGARRFLGLAAVAVAFAIIFMLVEFQSPDFVIWNGRCVPAFFDGGVAHYTVAGQQLTADDPPPSDLTPRTVRVCYYPSDPNNGYIVRPAAYWVEGGLVFGPLALAVFLVTVGVLTSARRLRKPSSLPPLPSFPRYPR